MDLSVLLASVPDPQVLTGASDLPVSEICYDSREARAGALFIALQGLHRDGHDYAAAAVANGASAVLVTRQLFLPEHVTQVLVADTWASN